MGLAFQGQSFEATCQTPVRPLNSARNLPHKSTQPVGLPSLFFRGVNFARKPIKVELSPLRTELAKQIKGLRKRSSPTAVISRSRGGPLFVPTTLNLLPQFGQCPRRGAVQGTNHFPPPTRPVKRFDNDELLFSKGR